MKLKRGSTSVRRLVFIGDSSSTTGAGLANLAHNTSGLVAWYFAGDLSNDLQITLASATLGTYTSGGFVAVDNTNMPGWYEIGIPNAVLDGGNEAAIQLRGAANMLPVNIYIELDSFDYQTATQPVNVTQFGGANGTFSGGRPEVTVTTNNDKTGYSLSQAFPTNFASLAITGGGAVTAGTVSDKTGYSLTQSFPTNFSSLAITGAGAVTAGTVSDKTGYSLSQSFPTNFASLAITGGGAVTAGTVSDKTGYSLATAPLDAAGVRAAVGLASANLDTQLGAMATTAGIAAINGSQFTAIPWNAAWDTEVQSEVIDALNQALTESYAAAGSTASVAQMLYMIQQHLGNAAISSTTKTVKKLDGSTTAGTFTLDSATDPTTIARAT